MIPIVEAQVVVKWSHTPCQARHPGQVVLLGAKTQTLSSESSQSSGENRHLPHVQVSPWNSGEMLWGMKVHEVNFTREGQRVFPKEKTQAKFQGTNGNSAHCQRGSNALRGGAFQRERRWEQRHKRWMNAEGPSNLVGGPGVRLQNENAVVCWNQGLENATCQARAICALSHWKSQTPCEGRWEEMDEKTSTKPACWETVRIWNWAVW